MSALHITGRMTHAYSEVLSPEVQAFIGELHTRFAERRNALLHKRKERQARIDAREFPDFRLETKEIRESDWKVAPIPEDLLDRRVEITGPVERKMVINALNSGAKVFMADFEDSLTPAWDALMDGQINMYDAVRKTIEYTNPDGKKYRLKDDIAVLIVRPRGWHLNEKHIEVDGQKAIGALVDFGAFFFRNAKEQLARGSGPYLYLPKLESAEEAALWADIFAFSEKYIGIPHGSIKATVLIETILATFEMHEILYALKDYCVGLNCGRWDYIFSFIKKFSKHPDFTLPERGQVVMTKHFLRSYSKLLIQTCHKRGAFAMGGMSAFIPVKGDEAANDKAFAAVRADKQREAGDGHDGTWVAHPGLVPVALEVFEAAFKGSNQLERPLEDIIITAADLLTIPDGNITEAGLRGNISVALQYIASWLAGNGCVPINNLMEDAATAEISRSQIWQWIQHGAKLDDGRTITLPLYRQLLEEEINALCKRMGEAQFDLLPYMQAKELLTELVSQAEFAEFLTLEGYRRIV